MRIECFYLLLGLLTFSIGCGSTRTTNTSRTATEQLLLSDAVDAALSKIQFTPLQNKKVYFNDKFIEGSDTKYVIGRVRQKLLDEGAYLQDDMGKSEIVLELIVGALGTDQYEFLVGIPQLSGLPMSTAIPIPPALPEIPIIKRTNQQAIAKLKLYAYERSTGALVALSSEPPSKTHNQSTWLLGLGPYETGTVRRDGQIAGESIPLPEISLPVIATNPAADSQEPLETVTVR